MNWLAVVVLVPSLASAAETYKCVSNDQSVGFTAVANLTLNGGTADLSISADGAGEFCRSTAGLKVAGKKPVLTLSGTVSCQGDDPEDVSMILNTSKKTLEMGPNVFDCK